MLGTLVLLALAPALQVAPSAETVTIAAAKAKVGDGVHVAATVETRYDVVFTVGGAKLREFERRTLDRRALDARVVPAPAGASGAAASTVVRLDYGECRSTLSDPSGDNVERFPVELRHYLATVAQDAPAAPAAQAAVQELDVAKNETSDVDDAVAAHVARDAGELLFGGGFAKILAGKPLAIGAPIRVEPDVARGLLAGVLDDCAVQSCTLTPKPPASVEDDVTFDAALAITMKQGDDFPVTSTFELAGPIVVGRATGRLVALDLAGPIRFGGATEEGGTRIEVTGTGTLTWTYRATPLPAR